MADKYGIDTVYEKETGNKVTFAPSKTLGGGGQKALLYGIMGN